MGVKQLFDLSGKTALITGGSRGLGLQMAEALGEMGAKLAITARKTDELAEAKAHLEGLGMEVHTFANDLQNFDAMPALVDDVLAQLGTIDILVNNAGATWGAPAETHPIQAWDKVMNLNVRGYFLLCQQVARRSMLLPREDGQGSRGGRIINIASIAGLGGNPPGMQTIAYNTSKAAVINFTRTLAGEWGPHGINVNAICPGFFPSKMTVGLLDKLGADKLAAHAPLRRLGDDEDLKGITLLFASDAGKHITGQWLAVDGGVSALIGG